MDEKTAIKKGFNAGYWMEKYEPELAKMLQDSFGDPDHPYAKGFVMGSREFTQEQFHKSSQDSLLEIREFTRGDIDKFIEHGNQKSKPDIEK